MKKCLIFFAFLIMIAGCTIQDYQNYQKIYYKIHRETLLDRKISIPDKLVLEMPNVMPYCDEIKKLKKGYVDVFNGKIYFEKEGSGIPIVLISGGPGLTHHSFHPYFSEISDFSRVIYYDQRGTGKSSYDNTGATYTVKQSIQDLEDLRKSLNIDKWIVLGWSYGGFLAQYYALNYPQNCLGLVLGVTATGIANNSAYSQVAKEYISKQENYAFENIGKNSQVQPGIILYNKFLAGYWKEWSFYKPKNEDIVRFILNACVCDNLYEEKMREEFMKMTRDDIFKGKFNNFTIPTLIVEGKYEASWWTNGNPKRIDVLKQNHPNAQIEIFQKSGHMIFADESDEFFELLKNFIKKIKF